MHSGALIHLSTLINLLIYLFINIPTMLKLLSRTSLLDFNLKVQKRSSIAVLWYTDITMGTFAQQTFYFDFKFCFIHIQHPHQMHLPCSCKPGILATSSKEIKSISCKSC